jgi:hypothetical protein
VEISFPPFKERFDIRISLTEFIQLTTIMRMSKVVATVRYQVDVWPVIADIFNPTATKSRVAIRASKLTSSVERDLQRFKIDVFVVGGLESDIDVLLVVDYCFVNPV